MEDRVRLTITVGIAEVRLNRAAKLNALDPGMFEAIAKAGARLKDDRSLRAVVLCGEGRAFCAGMDGESVAAMAHGGRLVPSTLQGMANRFQHIVWLWQSFPSPSSPQSTASLSAAVSSSLLAPICATSRRIRVFRLWKPNGDWCRIWLEPNSCVIWPARTWSAS